MRLAANADLPRIVEIYNQTITSRRATADTQAVTVDERQAWFASHTPEARPLLVEEEGAEVVGWLSFEDFYGRPAYAATAEISIYVDARYRAAGSGSRLLQAAIARAPALGLTTLVGFIFTHNTESIRLCERFGFETWGELPRIAVMDGVEYSLRIMGRRV